MILQNNMTSLSLRREILTTVCKLTYDHLREHQQVTNTYGACVTDAGQPARLLRHPGDHRHVPAEGRQRPAHRNVHAARARLLHLQPGRLSTRRRAQ